MRKPSKSALPSVKIRHINRPRRTLSSPLHSLHSVPGGGYKFFSGESVATATRAVAYLLFFITPLQHWCHYERRVEFVIAVRLVLFRQQLDLPVYVV